MTIGRCYLSYQLFILYRNYHRYCSFLMSGFLMIILMTRTRIDEHLPHQNISSKVHANQAVKWTAGPIDACSEKVVGIA